MIAAVTLSVQLQRTSFDLLDGLSIQIAARNSASRSVDVRFPAPAEYAIDVVHNGEAVWTSAAPPAAASPAFPPHVKRLLPGATILAVYVWNEETRDGSSVAPGNYLVRVRLLGDGVNPETSLPLHFAAPLPVSALASLRAGEVVTLSGRYDAAGQILADATGAIRLSKRLIGAPSQGSVAVRGYVSPGAGSAPAFVVTRWAKLATP